jgi:hypothetical protein
LGDALILRKTFAPQRSATTIFGMVDSARLRLRHRWAMIYAGVSSGPALGFFLIPPLVSEYSPDAANASLGEEV